MKTILMVVASINGTIDQDPVTSASWSSKVDKEFFKKISTAAGVVIMGRKTYEIIGRPLPSRLNVVMTRNPEHYVSATNQVFTSKEPGEILSWLEQEGYRTAIIAGGAEVYRLFLEAGLVDEILLTLEPIIFPGKVRLFDKLAGDIHLELKEIGHLDSSTIFVRYSVIKKLQISGGSVSGPE